MNNQIFDKYEFERLEKDNMILVKIYNNNAKKEWKRLISYKRFRTSEDREVFITNFIANVQSNIDYKNKRKAERKAIVATADLIGQVFYDSWGYDMTLVDYIKVVGITNKKVIAVLIGKEVKDDYGRGAGRSFPAKELVKSSPFQLSVRAGYNGGVSLVGQYPFVGSSESKRKGWFSKYEDGGNYYNTWD